MRSSATFSPRAKKQIAELAKKEKMLALPQMDSIVRHSCISPHRLRISDTLGAARGKQLGLLPTGELEEYWDLPILPPLRRGDDIFEQLFRNRLQEERRARQLWESSKVERIARRLEEEEQLERFKEARQQARQRERRGGYRIPIHMSGDTPAPAMLKQAVEKEADDLELKKALQQIEQQDEALVTEQRELCAAADRIKERLALYGLKEIPIEGNGNCQFASAAHFVGVSHSKVREKAVKWLRENPDFTLDAKATIRVRDFLDTDEFSSWEDYCKHMARDGVWGDHLTLIAIANVFDRNIFVVSTIPGGSGVTCIESKAPDSIAAERPAILLSHWHELHYNALTRDENSFA